MSSNENQKYDSLLKFMIVGDSGCGKTCLLLRYVDEAFTSSFMSTIGIDVKTKVVDSKNKSVKLQIWDTAGQERYRTITTSYFRGANGIFLVYDITNQESFFNVRNWMKCISEHASDQVQCILIGNKADMEDKRQVEVDQGESLAEEYGIPFFETSAMNNMNVSEAFTQLIDDTIDEAGLPKGKPKNNVALRPLPGSVSSVAVQNSQETKDSTTCCR